MRFKVIFIRIVKGHNLDVSVDLRVWFRGDHLWCYRVMTFDYCRVDGGVVTDRLSLILRVLVIKAFIVQNLGVLIIVDGWIGNLVMVLDLQEVADRVQ